MGPSADHLTEKSGWGVESIMVSYLLVSRSGACTATEMTPTIEMIPATEMTPNHHRNDPTTEMIPAVTTEMIPGISGMELRGLEKRDNNLVRAFYLFILHLFYGV